MKTSDQLGTQSKDKFTIKTQDNLKRKAKVQIAKWTLTALVFNFLFRKLLGWEDLFSQLGLLFSFIFKH